MPASKTSQQASNFKETHQEEKEHTIKINKLVGGQVRSKERSSRDLAR